MMKIGHVVPEICSRTDRQTHRQTDAVIAILRSTVTRGRGSVLLRRRFDTLCTSGFTDDVIYFFHSVRFAVSYGLLANKKGSQYSITERRVPELIPVLCSQPAGNVSHKPGGRLPLLSARPAVTPATLKRTATSFAAW